MPFCGGEVDEVPEKLKDLFAAYIDNPGKGQGIALALAAARGFFVADDSPEKHLLIVGQLLDWGVIELSEAVDLLSLSSGYMQRVSNDAKEILILADTLREDKDQINVSPAEFQPILMALERLRCFIDKNQ